MISFFIFYLQSKNRKCINEVEILCSFFFFYKAGKIHDEGPEADPVEKDEEIERMREHVMNEFDKNNDRMLSLEEFETGIRGKDAKNDQGWKVR